MQAFRNHQLKNFLEREQKTRQIHAPLPTNGVLVPLEFPRFLLISLLISASDLSWWVKGAACVRVTPPASTSFRSSSPFAPSPLHPSLLLTFGPRSAPGTVFCLHCACADLTRGCGSRVGNPLAEPWPVGSIGNCRSDASKRVK